MKLKIILCLALLAAAINPAFASKASLIEGWRKSCEARKGTFYPSLYVEDTNIDGNGQVQYGVHVEDHPREPTNWFYVSPPVKSAFTPDLYAAQGSAGLNTFLRLAFTMYRPVRLCVYTPTSFIMNAYYVNDFYS